MWEKWNALQISFYGIDESEQKVFNNRSGIKMTHLYCMNYSDWFAFFISILTASIVGLLQNGYQPDWNQSTKSCIVKSLTLWIRSRYKKSNAGQGESLQKTFSNLKENYSLVLYELTCIWLNYFYSYQWTSPMLGISTEIVISLKSNNKKLHTQGGLKGVKWLWGQNVSLSPNPKIYHFGGNFIPQTCTIKFWDFSTISQSVD